VYAGSYGLMPADGQAQSAGPAGCQPRVMAWPVQSSLVPPLADGFIARPETAPGLEAALVPGAAVGLAGALWQSRTVGQLFDHARRPRLVTAFARSADRRGSGELGVYALSCAEPGDLRSV